MRPFSLDHDWFAGSVPANAQFGDGSWLHSSFAFLHYASTRQNGLRVGHDTGLYKGTMFNLGADGELQIGDYCTLVAVVIDTNTRVVIGDYVFIAHEVVIADSAVAVPHGDGWAEGTRSAQPIVIEDDVWIGARAIIVGGAHIGAGSIVGAGALVTSAVPAYSIVAGNPAEVVGRVRPQA